MQITPESGASPNRIVAYSEDEIRLRDRVFRASIIAAPGTVIEDWRPPPVEQLTIESFAALFALEPELVILGTGPRQRLPPPRLYADFAARGIGFEVMDTGAACRTFNLLLSEARAVAIALIL